MDESEFTWLRSFRALPCKTQCFHRERQSCIGGLFFRSFFLSVLLNKRARSTTIIGGKRCNAGQFATSQLYPAAVRKQQMGGVALPYELENTFNVTLNRACIVSMYTDEYSLQAGLRTV